MMGYSASNGRACHCKTSSSTSSVTVEMSCGEISSKCPWISRTVIPRAYMAMTLLSKPGRRRWCFGDELRFEHRKPIARILRGSAPSGVMTGLAGAVAMVTRLGRLLPAGRFRVQVVRKLRGQHPLGELLLQAPGKASASQNTFRVFAPELTEQ